MNQNIDCLVAIKNFGATVYANLCNNASTIVPWGFWDWVEGILILSACLIVTIALIALVWMFVSSFLYERKATKAPGMQE